MAVTYVGADAQVSGGSANVTVTIPAAAEVDDVAYLFWASISTADHITPSGWTVLGHGYNGNEEWGYYRRVLTSGEPGSTLTLTDGVANKTVACLIVVRGADTTAPEGSESTAPLAVNATSTTRALEPATLTSERLCITAVLARGSVTLSTWTPPAGFTSAASAFGTGGGETNGAVAYGTHPAGTVSGNWVSNVADARGVTFLLVIEPAASGPSAVMWVDGVAVNVLGVWNGSSVDAVDVLGVWNGATVDAVNT